MSQELSKGATSEPPISDAEFLRAYLVDRDVACPSCGYNLRQLQGDRCPECGDQIHLHIGLTEPKQAALIAGLLGLGAGAGLNGLLIIYAILMTLFLRPGGAGLWGRFMLINAIGAVVLSAFIYVWIRNWAHIRRMAPWRRRWLVIGCGFLSLLDLVIFAIYIR